MVRWNYLNIKVKKEKEKYDNFIGSLDLLVILYLYIGGFF